jgi:hypothetical protein
MFCSCPGEMASTRSWRTKRFSSFCTSGGGFESGLLGLHGSASLRCGRFARGKKAHWASHDLLSLFGALPVDARVVHDGRLVSAAGLPLVSMLLFEWLRSCGALKRLKGSNSTFSTRPSLPSTAAHQIQPLRAWWKPRALRYETFFRRAQKLQGVPLPERGGKRVYERRIERRLTGELLPSSLPRTLNDRIAPARIPAIIDVTVVVIRLAAVDAGAIARWQNSNDTLRRGTYCRLAYDNPIGCSALLVDQATRGRQSDPHERERKNCFHGFLDFLIPESFAVFAARVSFSGPKPEGSSISLVDSA